MPEVDLSVVGKTGEPVIFDYTFTDVVLYALGVGATAEDLPLVYEGAPGGLKVLASFCVVPAMKAFPYVGEDVEWSRFLHGEQRFRLHQPLPPEGRLVQSGKVAAIHDKGKGALYRIEIKGGLADGTPVYEVDWIVFYLGAGGFGGDPGPKAEILAPPEGAEPDFIVSDRVAENQAAIYRLSGDLNPLHIDPAAAKRGGFDRPILHGLCTFGFATRAIVNGPLSGEVERLKDFSARFSGPVYCGDSLTIKGWKTGGGYIIQVESQNGVLLSNGLALIQ